MSQRPSTAPTTYRADAPVAASIAFLAETAISGGFASGSLLFPIALAAHLGLLAGLLVLLANAVRGGRDCGPLLLLIPAVAFTGPFGAFGGMIVGRMSRRGASDVERLEDWYRRLSLSTALDPTSRLADHVSTGRALNFDLHADAPMTVLIATGTVGEKQAILGLVARKFHPDYLPVLQQALVADEPVIRVQAAAVAARIRGEMPALVERLLKRAADPSTSPEAIVTLVSEVRLCLTSGLMEAKDRDHAARLIDGLFARTLLRSERQAVTDPTLKGQNALADALEEHLLASRRFTEFRRLRRARRCAARGPYRWRPLARCAAPRSVA